MARKGKDFELLIEKLHKCFEKEALIKSPDFIMDIVTGTRREVDISIRYNIGMVDFLIIIECRDRKAKEDVKWIEQLITKSKDTNANRTIAVTSSSFSKGAIKKAANYGIEVRTFNEITYEVIKDWWFVSEMNILTQEYEIVNTIITTEKELPVDFKVENGTVDIVTRASDCQLFSTNKLFEFLHDKIPDWVFSIDPAIQPIRQIINASADQLENRLYIKIKGIEYNISQIEYTVDFYVRMKKQSISKISSYSGNDGPISTVIEFNNIRKNCSLHFIKNPDGSISMSSK